MPYKVALPFESVNKILTWHTELEPAVRAAVKTATSFPGSLFFPPQRERESLFSLSLGRVEGLRKDNIGLWEVTSWVILRSSHEPRSDYTGN